MALYCGIDFGTSNSTVGLADDRSAYLIPLEDAHPTLPSAVFWDSDGAPPLFGRAAIAAYMGGEEGRLMRGLKSTLGSALLSERTAVGRHSVSFQTVLARFLGHLRQRLDATAPGLTSVVMGRPVHFVDADPAADTAAQAALDSIARGLGFTEVGFQYEPIAAALHFEQSLQDETLALIFDIGGGTSDISVVRLSPDRALRPDRAADILANGGIRVGGTDFDRLLSLAEVMPHLGFRASTKGGTGLMPRHYYLDLATWHRINALYTARTAADLKALRADADRPELIDRLLHVIDHRNGHALALQVESAKIALSDADTARLALSSLSRAPNPVVRRESFEQAVEAPVARIRALIDSVLSDAGVAPAQIGTVFMTGGSSGLPLLRATVADALPMAHIAMGDMLGSVGSGLALDARRRYA